LPAVLGIKHAAIVLIQTACFLRKLLRQRFDFSAAGSASLTHFLLPFLSCVPLYIFLKPLNLFYSSGTSHNYSLSVGCLFLAVFSTLHSLLAALQCVGKSRAKAAHASLNGTFHRFEGLFIVEHAK
jgi:hypothetical protein